MRHRAKLILGTAYVEQSTCGGGGGGGSPLVLAGRKIKADYETKRAYQWRQPSKNRGPCGLPQRTLNFLDALFLKDISFVFIL